MDIFKIVIFAVVAGILCIFLKKNSPEMALLTSLIAGVLIFLYIISYVNDLIDIINKIALTSGINIKYLEIIFKVIGVSYIAEFGIQLLKDAGENAIASKIEIGAKICILILSSPIITGLVDLVLNMAL